MTVAALASIIQVEEDDNGELTMTAAEIPGWRCSFIYHEGHEGMHEGTRWRFFRAKRQSFRQRPTINGASRH